MASQVCMNTAMFNINLPVKHIMGKFNAYSDSLFRCQYCIMWIIM